MKSGAKQQWLATVRRTLPGKLAAQAIAGALADRMNSKTGRLNPSYQTLADDIGVSAETAKRAVRYLRVAGLLEIERPGGKGPRSSNYYSLKGVTPDTLKREKGGHPCPPQNALRGSNEGAKRGSPVTHESERMNPSAANPSGPAAERGLGNSASADDCGSALGGRPPPSAPADGEEQEQARVNVRLEREKLRSILASIQ